MNEQAEPMTDGPGQAAFRFVRYWSRRSMAAVAGQVADPDRGRDVMVTEAIQALQASGEVTVNDVADQLGIDQSGASRFITQAVEHGYVSKIASPTDARKRHLVVTESGDELVEAAHQWQEAVFAELTSDWSPAEIRQFHYLMERLIAASKT